MNYKLIVLDLDGTLTNNKKEISERNKTTLIQAQKDGAKIVLASGRPTYGIVPLAEELEMEKYGGYILSYNGGEIINWKTKEMIYENILPNSVIPTLYRYATEHQLALLSYNDSCIITEYPDDEYVGKEAFLNKMEVKKAQCFINEITLPLPKCLIVGDPEKIINAEKEVKELVQNEINVFRSEPYFLELVPQGIDKALSLNVLINKLGIKQEEMIAIGDGFNDLSMIEFAGMGIAMANAQEAVKKAAKHITLSNEEDGVAVAIEKFFKLSSPILSA